MRQAPPGDIYLHSARLCRALQDVPELLRPADSRRDPSAYVRPNGLLLPRLQSCGAAPLSQRGAGLSRHYLHRSYIAQTLSDASASPSGAGFYPRQPARSLHHPLGFFRGCQGRCPECSFADLCRLRPPLMAAAPERGGGLGALAPCHLHSLPPAFGLAPHLTRVHRTGTVGGVNPPRARRSLPNPIGTRRPRSRAGPRSRDPAAVSASPARIPA